MYGHVRLKIFPSKVAYNRCTPILRVSRLDKNYLRDLPYDSVRLVGLVYPTT